MEQCSRKRRIGEVETVLYRSKTICNSYSSQTISDYHFTNGQVQFSTDKVVKTMHVCTSKIFFIEREGVAAEKFLTAARKWAWSS